MENLSIADGPPGAQPPPGHSPLPLGPGTPSATPQLPPQMFTTAAQLLDLTDKKLMVALRDGRKLIGVLRSWDQFANIVLQSTIERIFAPPATSTGGSPSSSSPPPDTAEGKAAAAADQGHGLYADIPHGVFLVRGENVLLLGEIDLDRDDDPPPGYDRADVAVVRRLAAERKDRERERAKVKNRRLATLGFEGENLGEILL